MAEPRKYGLYIKRINAWLDCESNRNMQSRNMTRSQTHFLMELRRRPEQTATLKEMEARTNSAQSTVAGLAKRLEKKGLVEGFFDPRDKRVKRVRLTQAGEVCCKTSIEEITATEEQLVSDLSECERTLLINLLERMYETVRGTSQE